MAKYRFKTKEEFIRDGEWFHKRNTPIFWNDAGRMNHFLGQDIPEKYNSKCDSKDSFSYDDWHFKSSNYVLKETKSVNRHTDFVFIPGNIYVGEWDGNRVIFKPTTSCLDDPCYIINSINEFKLSKNGCCKSKDTSFREANQEEKDWLEACIKANATVPKPSNSIPEYVECVKEKVACYGEKGKIYKVITWKYNSNDCMLEGTTSGSTDRSRFKPSTKEAYDAQNTPVVDKWAIKCTEENKEHLEKFFHSKSSEYNGYTSSWSVSIGHYYHYPQQEEGLWGHMAIQKDYREITNEEFYRIAGVVSDVDTPTFEVGKWYKIKNAIKAYRKCSHKQLSNERMLYSEGIDNGKYNSISSSCGASNNRLELLTDLSEIQPYLPDDHPDKFPVAEQKMFKKGDYIVITECNYKGFIGKLNHCYKIIGDNFSIGDYDRIPLDKPESKKARLATPEEIAEYDRLGEPYNVRTLVKEKPQEQTFNKEMKKTIDFKSLSFGEWLEETKKLNLSLYDLQQHINNGSKCDFKNVYSRIPGDTYNQKGEYLFNLWNSEKQPSIPQYVKCINGYGNAVVGKIYRTDDEYQAKKLFGITWEQVLIKYNHLGTKFISATYLEYSEYHSERAEESKPLTTGYPIKKETLIEDVHSVSVMLSTKNKSKQFKF